MLKDIRTYLKKVFWPNLGVGSGFQILEIPAYVCGLKPEPAYILNQNSFFEIGSRMAMAIWMVLLAIFVVGGCQPAGQKTGGIDVMFTENPHIVSENVFRQSKTIGTIADAKVGNNGITKVTIRLDAQFEKQAGHHWAFYADRGRLKAERLSISGGAVSAGDPVCGFSSKASLNWFKIKTLLKNRVANAMRRADSLQRRFG